MKKSGAGQVKTGSSLFELSLEEASSDSSDVREKSTTTDEQERRLT